MATDVNLPQWGMNMESGLLVKWLVKEGDEVVAGQPLVEVETSKINSELESPGSGVVAHIMFSEGTTVDVGETVVVLAEPGENPPRPSGKTSKPKNELPIANKAVPTGSGKTSQKNRQVTPVARRLAGSEGIDIDLVQGTGPNGRVTEQDVRNFIEQLKTPSSEINVQVVPKARKLASDNGIDLAEIKGTGPSGRITVVDVEKHLAKAGPRIPPEDILESIPIVGMRKTISERMSLSSSETAPVTLTTEVDMTETVKAKESLVSAWRKEKLRPLDLYLILKAVVDSLREHSILNATLSGNNIIVMKHVNLGVAVALPDGLIVPVLREAENMDLVDIARNIGDLTRKARDNKLSIDEVTGSTFTVTSLAAYDIDGFTPIINVPEIAILGVGRILQRPWVVDGEIGLRQIMTLSLTFDHRAIDGVPAGDFLKTLKAGLENPVN